MKTNAGILAVTMSAVAIAAAGASAHRSAMGAAGAQTASATAERSPVVIELFTSEGCSTCPPVDRLLSELEKKQPVPGVEIIALEEHVDYWNHDGWEDPFSGQEWTLRQREYVAKFKGDTPYTPQMILNGEKVAGLKNGAQVLEEILQASKEERAEVSIAAAGSEKNSTPKFEVHVGSLQGASAPEKAEVWIAVTEDGLQSDVKAGENNGKTLGHAAVVRSLQKIGTTAKGAAPFAANTEVKLKSNWKRENLRVVVLVQDRKSWRILGAATTKVS